MAKILVIDDDPTYRLLVVRTLVEMGHTVESAPSGSAALLRLAADNFDLIVTDIFMDDMDGFEFMRAKSTTTQALVLAISGGGSGSLAGEAPNFLRIACHLGADAALAKPFAMGALKDAVTSLLHGTRPLPPGAFAAHTDAPDRLAERSGE